VETKNKRNHQNVGMRNESKGVESMFPSPIKIHRETRIQYGRVSKARGMRHPATSQDYTFVVSTFYKGANVLSMGERAIVGWTTFPTYYERRSSRDKWPTQNTHGYKTTDT
jgi:hypothetical protein